MTLLWFFLGFLTGIVAFTIILLMVVLQDVRALNGRKKEGGWDE